MLHLNRNSRPVRGFSLVELLVTITILSVLSAMAVFSVRALTNDADGAACSQDAATLSNAQEAYFAKNGSFAPQDELVQAGFLRTASTLYKIEVTLDSYKLTPTGSCPDSKTTPSTTVPAPSEGERSAAATCDLIEIIANAIDETTASMPSDATEEDYNQAILKVYARPDIQKAMLHMVKVAPKDILSDIELLSNVYVSQANGKPVDDTGAPEAQERMNVWVGSNCKWAS